MSENVRQAFDDYIALASRVLTVPRRDWSLEGASVRLEDSAELRMRVDYLEKGHEFGRLVEDTNRVFAQRPDHLSQLFCKPAVGNFFRRSGYYLDGFDGRVFHRESSNALFRKYDAAFKSRQSNVRYLAPLEFVSFEEARMDFERFSLRRFTQDELDQLFCNRINRVFFPWAAIDTGKLQPYWFLVVTESIPALEFGEDCLELGHPEVNVSYTAFPRPVEATLRVLALFDWQANVWPYNGAFDDLPDEKGKRWLRFSVPFVVKLDDNLLKSPLPSPDLSVLEMEPDFDPETSEQRGESPVDLIELDDDQTRRFTRFISRLTNLHDSLWVQENEWQFLDVALGYLTKALFAEGLEQLLWHITALEALVGEKGHGMTERLKKRVASLIGTNEIQRTAISKHFDDLYKLRCDLVHGRPLKTQAYVGDLRRARDLARRTALWFIRYLAHVQAHFPPGAQRSRESLLELLDLGDEQRRPSASLLAMMPPNFPPVPEWLE